MDIIDVWNLRTTEIWVSLWNRTFIYQNENNSEIHYSLYQTLFSPWNYYHFVGKCPKRAVIDFIISPPTVCILRACRHSFNELRHWPKAESIVPYTIQMHWWYSWGTMSLNRWVHIQFICRKRGGKVLPNRLFSINIKRSV